MKQLKIQIYINLILVTLYVLFSFSFHADISLLAFPISALTLLVMIWQLYFVFYKKQAISKVNVIRRILQYEPFALITAFVLQRSGKYDVPYIVDVIGAIFWTLVTISSIILQFFLSEKRVYSLNDSWKTEREHNVAKKYTGFKRVIFEILDWLDAIVWSVFVIFLLNIFILQLYEIPSESMVSTFLIKDRVAAIKTFSGPKFPLSKAGLPYFRKYKRGDVVVIRNPHYEHDRESEFKTFFSQFIYMVTLTIVKTNRDENGELKADPLVKRVQGLPGEQLILMDGKLYARTADSDFKEIEDPYAEWNLSANTALYDFSKNNLKIQKLPISEIYSEQIQNVGKNKNYWQYTLREAISAEQSLYDDTLKVELNRRNLNLAEVAKECESLSARFASLAQGKNIPESEVKNLFSLEERFEYSLLADTTDLTMTLLSAAGSSQWFDHFMNDWHRQNVTGLNKMETYFEDEKIVGENLIGGDLYSDSCFRLNVMTKIAFAKIIVRNAELASSGVNTSLWSADSERMEAFEDARLLHAYLIRMDQRNMGLFPPSSENGKPNFIPENSYFMMGDNRYNSLDLRHSYERKIVALTKYDPYSISYYTNLEPQYIDRSLMQGTANLRFWPLSRFGLTK